MGDANIVEVITSFGGLGLLGLFAWLLLKSVLKQQERLTEMIENHLKTLLDRAEKANRFLEHLCDRMKEGK